MYWGKGRQLMRIQNGENEYLYTYNASGIRTSKTVGGVKHSFTLDGAKILRDNWTETDENGNTYEANMTFLYDNEDTVCGFQHNAIMYYYLKNLQGDVIAIVDESGTTVARYTYDAWGACTISYDATATATGETKPVHIATINPFRYRSYYFDTETGLYYLQSRYYAPALGRFLNGDDPMYLGYTEEVVAWNCFAYCWNNPVNTEDQTGCFGIRITVPRFPYFTVKKLLAFAKKSKQIIRKIIYAAKIARTIVFGVARNIKQLNAWFKENVQITTYRGVPVLVLKCLKYDAFSFGIIVIGKDEYQRCIEGNSVTLEHEYGHVIQLMSVGFPAYVFWYFIPSLIGYRLDLSYDTYYSLPWEYTVDMFGGAKRSDCNYWGNSAILGTIYFALSLCITFLLKMVM